MKTGGSTDYRILFCRFPYWICLLQVFYSLLFVSCRAEQGNYTAVNQNGQYVYGVWNARTAKAAKALSRQIAQSWTKAPPQIDSPPIIANTKPTEFLPVDGDVSHWVRSGVPSRYIGKDLYKNVIGGNPELFHAYGFIEQTNIEYQTPRLGSKPLILVEIFDMGSPENAFGLYSRNRYPQDKFEWVGSKAIFSGSLLSFWKGKYFVQIEGYEFAGQIKQGMIALAKAIATRIKDSPTKPPLLTLLPQQSQVPYSEKYFPIGSVLHEVHRFLPDGILKLGTHVTGCSAAYLHDKSSKDWIDTMTALVIRYGAESEAKAAYNTYRSYLQENVIAFDTPQTGGIIAREE